jgi:hypothetical protein
MTLDPNVSEVPSESTQELQGHAQNSFTGSLLLGILKSIENELRKRELITSSHLPPTPLWFLAETERNIFLWRSNQSLDDAKRYSFWVDLQSLINKRRDQLTRPQESNPFINPLWGSGPIDATLVQREHDYLEALEDLIPTVFRRGESLSHASESLRLEIDPESSRTAVVIPTTVTPHRA